MASTNCVVIVFAKSPLPGKVKTRLAKDIGTRNAVRIYKNMLYALLQNLTSQNEIKVELWCSPDIKHPFLRKCARDFDIVLKKQTGCDLGMKMTNAFRYSLKKYDSCILLGSDIPDINKDDVIQSCYFLRNSHDVVVLPVEDGGYGLIAMTEFMPDLFRHISWSTDVVMRQTLRKMQKNNCHCHVLNKKIDIDTKADLRRYNFK